MCFIIVNGRMCVMQFSRCRLYTAIGLLVVCVAAGLLEVIRVYLGFEGNLREKVFRQHCCCCRLVGDRKK